MLHAVAWLKILLFRERKALKPLYMLMNQGRTVVKFHRLPFTVLRGCSAIVSFEYLRWKLRKLRRFDFHCERDGMRYR